MTGPPAATEPSSRRPLSHRWPVLVTVAPPHRVVSATTLLVEEDQQGAEVRVIDPDGRYLRAIVRWGEGAGEISGANGISLSGEHSPGHGCRCLRPR